MAKTNSNDERILALQARIAEQEALLKSTERFSPVTNCSLTLNGVRTNLNVLNREELIMLKVTLRAMINAAKDENLLEQCVVSGYKLSEWYQDVSAKLSLVDRKQEEARLAKMKKQLAALLSAEKQTELAIAEIEELLGDK